MSTDIIATILEVTAELRAFFFSFFLFFLGVCWGGGRGGGKGVPFQCVCSCFIQLDFPGLLSKQFSSVQLKTG